MWRKFPSEDATSHHCLWGSKKWCMYFSFQAVVQLFSAIWVICLNWISSALSAAGVVPYCYLDFTPPTCRPLKHFLLYCNLKKKESNHQDKTVNRENWYQQQSHMRSQTDQVLETCIYKYPGLQVRHMRPNEHRWAWWTKHTEKQKEKPERRDLNS